MQYFPCAKINLGLNVVERRNDGYHDIETVFWPVDIHDELEVNTDDTTDGCRLEVVGVSELCAPEKNLVVKAYNLMRRHYDIGGVRVRLTKDLPSQAGMGGGSSDGAFMIRAINELFSLGVDEAEMQRLAAQLGADCPFFIKSSPSYATGIGDRLQPLDVGKMKSSLRGLHVALVKPDVAVSTKEAYAGITVRKPAKNCMEVVMNQPVWTWREDLRNDFEDSVFRKLPILNDIKERLYEKGALYAAMSGSGSTVFGIFEQRPIFTETEYAKYYNKIVTL